MNPKLTPEIRSALQNSPAGPVQLDGDLNGNPVFVVRMEDIANIQALVDERLRERLAEADQDIADGNVSEWNASEFKSQARQRRANHFLILCGGARIVLSLS